MSWWRAWAGIAGPAAFIASWGVLGTVRSGYSPVEDPISQLAALAAPTRPVMTAGLLAFAAAMRVYSPVLRGRFSGGTATAATLTAVGTLGIAVLPLGGPGGDEPHGVAAVFAYGALAAMPLLAGRSLLERGHRRAAAASIACGVSAAAMLMASVVLPEGTGLTQRLGLTIGDLWIMASAVPALRATSSSESRAI